MTLFKCLLRPSLFVFLFLPSISVFAQYSTSTFKTGLPKNRIPLANLQAHSYRLEEPAALDSLLRLDSLGQQPGDGHYAVPLPLAISVLSSARVYESRDSVYYLLRLSADRAKSLSLHFNQFYLSPHAVLSLYTDREISDSISAQQNNPNHFFATRVYHSPTLNLVLRMPLAEKGMCELQISQAFLGYQSGAGVPGASQPCNVNLACPAGNGWQTPAHAVALITDGANYFTGTLVMNTCGANIPYILTANHVIDGTHTPGAWSFSFQFWSVDCDNNTPSNQEINFSGAELRASSTGSDFALLELYQKPAANSGLAYAGWTRQSQGIQETTILHHPQGDVMKVSHDNGVPIIDKYPVVQFPADCWRIDLDLGATEGGSSGAPYFDQNQRIFAQHEGEGSGQIYLNPCLRTKKWGGRFNVSWFGGGTKASSLNQWLDPKNTGAMTTNTTYVSQLVSASAISGPEKLCTEGIYTLGNLPAGATASWSTNPPLGINLLEANGASVKLSNANNTSGYVNITVSLSPDNTACGIPNTVTKTILVGKPSLAGFGGSYSTLSFATNFTGQTSFCLKTYNFPGMYSGEITINSIMASSYSWKLLSTWHPTNNPVTTGIGLIPGTTNSYNVYVKPKDGRATYRLTMSNSCGYYTRDFTFTADGFCSVLEDSIFFNPELAISPNPGVSEFKLELNSSINHVIEQVIIHDRNGHELKRIQFNNYESNRVLNLQDLPADVYVIRAFDGRTWFSGQIIKQ